MSLKDGEPEHFYARGAALSDSGRTKEALRDLSLAIFMDPANDKHYGNRALAYQALGNYEKSLSDFRKALSINPQTGYVAAWNKPCQVHKKDFQGGYSDWKRLSQAGVKNATEPLAQYGK